MLIDAPVWEARGRRWSHLASDTSYAELHSFAAGVGLHPFSYDGDHYDVPSDRYDEVVAAGAVPSSSREILARVQAAGLRFAKRRGERPVAAVPDGLSWLDAPHRLDLLASDRPTPPPTTVAVATYLTDTAGRVLLTHSAERDAWEGPGGRRHEDESPADAAARHLAHVAGLQVPTTSLEPCAYGRVHLHDNGIGADTGADDAEADAARSNRQLFHLPTSHIAVFRATVDVGLLSVPGKPAPDTASDDAPGLLMSWRRRVGWFTDDELAGLCADQPWWPILSRLRLAAGSQQR